jgi:hypothetical protein
MNLARAVFQQPDKLDHESLLSFVHFPALTSDVRLVFSKSILIPSENNGKNLNISFMNDIYILYNDRNKIGTKPPDAEL